MNKMKLIDFNNIEKLTMKDKKTLLERTLKLSEEVGEVSQAVLSSSKACGCSYKNKSNDDIIEECLDVIIVASSIISQSCNNDVDLSKIEKIYNEKLEKWEQKCILDK